MKRQYILIINVVGNNDGKIKEVSFEVDTNSDECQEYYDVFPNGDYTHWKAQQILNQNIEWSYVRKENA